MSGEWTTGEAPCYSKQPMAKYTIMIRAPNDPERKPRPVGGQADRTPHMTLSKWDVKTIKKEIMKLMRDGKERTLNAIGVELWDKTADITSGTPVEDALWDLVLERKLEWWTYAPILFRIPKD